MNLYRCTVYTFVHYPFLEAIIIIITITIILLPFHKSTTMSDFLFYIHQYFIHFVYIYVYHKPNTTIPDACSVLYGISLWCLDTTIQAYAQCASRMHTYTHIHIDTNTHESTNRLILV